MVLHPDTIIVRYILLAGAALGITSSGRQLTHPWGLAFYLVIVISVQLRMFTVTGQRVRNWLVLAEILFMIPLAYFWGGYAFPIAGLLAMEAGLTPGHLRAEGYFMLLLVSQALLLWPGDRLVFWMGLLFSLMCFLVFRFLRDEFRRKQEAQTLYDRLRLSEDKLKKAYHDLEQHAQSVEEITRLRERNRISREIHDSVGHDLSAILIQLGALDKLSSGDERLNPMIRQLKDYSKDSLEHVRQAVQDLKPDEYKKVDSIILIENLVSQYRKLTGKDVVFSFSRERWALNDDQYAAVYRVIQEFLGNSAKHSDADKVSLTMLFSKTHLTMTLKDNGRGSEHLIKGFGLSSMEERVEELGGTVEFETAADEGFSARIRLPRVQKLKLYGEETDG